MLLMKKLCKTKILTLATFFCTNLLSAFAHFCIWSLWKHIVVVRTCVIVGESLSAVHLRLSGRWSGLMKNGTDRRPFMWRKSPSQAPRQRPQQETPGEEALFQSHWSLGLKMRKRVWMSVGHIRRSLVTPEALLRFQQQRLLAPLEDQRPRGRVGGSYADSTQRSCVFLLRKPLVTAARLLNMIRLRNATHGRAGVAYVLTHPHTECITLSLSFSHVITRQWL